VKPLLQQIASVYLLEHEQELGNMLFVFPNRRAGLFFLNYLSKMIDRPLFAPETMTVNELFARLSNLQTADRISLLFRLYTIYQSLSKKEESFDKFAYWGEMLLNDFDDVDKYLADARQLFTNVTELKQIDSLFDYLSPNQIEAIRRFWSSFVPTSESAKQKDFRATWEILYPVYEKLHAELLASGEGYEGMIFREVAERMQRRKELPVEWNRIVFVGFNALTPAEEKLFTYFRNNGLADFYWDYDIEELEDSVNRGSDFRQANLEQFKSRYELIDGETRERTIELTGIPSAVGQAKYVHQLLRELYPSNKEAYTSEELMKTVVILSDENLLLPMLHSVPQELDKVNVTMGYPLSITPAATLIDNLFALQRTIRQKGEQSLFYYRNVQMILQHPYLLQLAGKEAKAISDSITQYNKIYIPAEEFADNELLASVFVSNESPRQMAAYLTKLLRLLLQRLQTTEESTPTVHLEQEFLYHCYTAVNRIEGLLHNTEIELTNETFARLMKQLIAAVSIPFEGEPLAGLQIMGLLETRGLDFENVIITSLNEGVFPQKQSAPSFIPYHLRKGFGLPTGEHQDAIFAYHFYRLIHRAKKVICTYDTRSEGLQSGEVSRYIHQLKYHYRQPITEKIASFDISFSKPETVEITKTEAIQQKLTPFLTEGSRRALSASAINAYLDCPLKFYLSTVEGLQESDDVEETIAASTFGSIFHGAMEELYNTMKGRMVTAEAIDSVLKSPTAINDAVALAFTRSFLKKEEGIVYPEGQHLLTTGIIQKYIEQLLRNDKKLTPFEYVASEFRFDERFALPSGKSVNLKGFIDRIDRKEGVTRILDYKTGSHDLTVFSGIGQLFDKEEKKRPKAVMQTFMYALLYQQQQGNCAIEPGIVIIRSLFKSDDTKLYCKPERQAMPVDDFNDYKEEFSAAFAQCLDEIFDPALPFVQTQNSDVCKYCPFTVICKR
jgi:hypothetical protein